MLISANDKKKKCYYANARNFKVVRWDCHSIHCLYVMFNDCCNHNHQKTNPSSCSCFDAIVVDVVVVDGFGSGFVVGDCQYQQRNWQQFGHRMQSNPRDEFQEIQVVLEE